MEYKPLHTQPFTVEQAALLELSVITAGGCILKYLYHDLTPLIEIARLQNSLEHLRDTQQQLQENVESEENCDPVILQAFEENKVVMYVMPHFSARLTQLASTFQIVSRRTSVHVASCSGGQGSCASYQYTL